MYFSFFLLALVSSPSIRVSLPWFLIFMPIFSSPFLPCCSTHSILLPQSSVFYAGISVLPMYFSFCSLIYFSIFIIHHLPVNLLSPHPSLHPCLLEGNVSAFQLSSIPHFLLLLFSICTYAKCITQCITIWFYPPEPSSLSGRLATANLEFNLTRAEAIAREADGQRLRQKMLGNSSINLYCPLCHAVHPLSLFLWLYERMRARGKERERVWGICRRVCRMAAAVSALTTYFTTYLHILKPSCNIASQSSAVACCRSHQFSASLSFMCNLFVWLTSSYWDYLSWATSCPYVTECILCYLLYYLHWLSDSLLSACKEVLQKCCRTSLQAQGFHSSLRYKTAQTIKIGTIKPCKRSYNCTTAFFALPQ